VRTPIIDSGKDTAGADDAARHGPPGGTVFVVDDDGAVRDSLQVLLEANGFQVAAYGSSQAFLDWILASYDPEMTACVLMDMRMPGIDGLELQSRLTAASIDLPVIVVTGWGTVPMAVQAVKAGATDVIEKPLREDVILQRVRDALESCQRTRHEAGLGRLATARLALLTPREREVLAHLVQGEPNKVIAHALSISPRTVEVHRARVMEKMQVRSLSHLIRLALAAGVGAESA
jgi:two-component system response regulator FixJ